MTRTFLGCLGLSVCLFGFSSLEGRQAKTPSPAVSADMKELVAGNSEFAFDLYRQLTTKEKGNIVFSPYSISTALAMTYAGARGKVAEDMAKALHFTLPQERLHAACGHLIEDLQKEEKERPYQLFVANAVWPKKGIVLLPEFLQLVQKNYRTDIQQLDYMNETEKSRETINRWVEDKTKDKIKELLLKGDLKHNTPLVLTNAIYFKATWKYQFSKERTKLASFDVSPSVKANVPIMQHEGLRLRYYSGEGFQWLELPYKGDKLSMLVMLPQKKGQLANLEKTLTATAIQQGIQHLTLHQGDIALPRFTMTLRLSVLELLAKMGMPIGPFSGITGAGLLIQDVIHKAFIDVDEIGTEAAAATAVIFEETAVRPFTFQADHPFLFLIRDRQTGSILFQGRVADPRS